MVLNNLLARLVVDLRLLEKYDPMHLMKYLNLTLLIVFPLAWFAPLLRTSLPPEM